jgi:hypothetical protein
MLTRRTILVLLAFVVLACGLTAQEVVRCPTQSLSLSECWRWASRDGSRLIGGRECWVGYSVKRLMYQDSYVNSGSISSGNGERRRDLYEVIYGDTSGRRENSRNWGGTEKNRIFKVLKDVAILMRISGNFDAEGSTKKLELSNMELHVDLRNTPLLWLGEADDNQSVGLLKELFDRQPSIQMQKDLVTAIGIHQNSTNGLPFLTTVLKSEQDDNLSSQAAFWIGEQNRAESLPILMAAAKGDRSAKVKEQCVFAISRLSSDESTDALIELAREAKDTKVRGKAAFWLGRKASQKAVATLESIIADDDETDVQRQALFALAQIHSSEGVERLIQIAKTHPHPRIRKQAIQCLGQSDDPRALEALIAIVRK